MDLHFRPESLGQGRSLAVVTGGDVQSRAAFCEALVASVSPNTFVARVAAPVFCEDDLIDRMLRDFGVVSDDEIRSRQRASVGLDQLFDVLEQFLRGLSPLKAHALLIVEHAEDASAVLGRIHQLSTLEADGHQLLQIVLVGSSGFRAMLASPERAALNDRITEQHELPPGGVKGLWGVRVSLQMAAAVMVVASALAVAVAAALYVRFGH